MKQLIADSVALLRRMVAIQSLSFGEENVRAEIEKALKEWGIEYSVLKNNIIARCAGYDPKKPVLAMDAHIDTVPAAASYTRDPFDAGNDPEIVYGLGSNDDGGSVVSMIAAFRYFNAICAGNLASSGDSGMPFNIVLTLSAEEERSGPGGAEYTYRQRAAFPEGEFPRWTIIGEPTGMRAATSERGLLVLDGEATGVSGHAARGEGINALYIAMDDIQALRAHEFTRISPIMGSIRLSVTQINAGTAHNVIPDKCTFVVDVRPTEQYTPEQLYDELQALCKSKLTPRNLRNRSSATPSDSLLLKAVQTLGIETFSSPTTSDWLRVDGDAIKMGPGDSSRSHHADEFIKVSEISDAVEKYIAFVKTFAQL